MAFNNDLASYESTWMNDADSYDRSERQREEREMQDWDMTEEEAIAARREASELAQWPITCDGSGILEEFYVDVDQTEVVKCQGYPACDLELAGFAGVRRKSAAAEVSAPAQRVA